MNDLISRSALLEEYEWLKSQVNSSSAPEIEEHIERIKKAPAVEAVPVIRCRDCLYSTDSWAKVNSKGFLICPASGMEITDNDYCSYGERRNGDATD